MEQTAVEWLVSQLNKQGFAQVVTDEEIKQAKKMEMEQTIGFVDEYEYYFLKGGKATMEQYYNEIFKSE